MSPARRVSGSALDLMTLTENKQTNKQTLALRVKFKSSELDTLILIGSYLSKRRHRVFTGYINLNLKEIIQLEIYI